MVFFQIAVQAEWGNTPVPLHGVVRVRVVTLGEKSVIWVTLGWGCMFTMPDHLNSVAVYAQAASLSSTSVRSRCAASRGLFTALAGGALTFAALRKGTEAALRQSHSIASDSPYQSAYFDVIRITYSDTELSLW
jgi:hypothetical protein